jgi:hypothetical protein
MNPSNSECKTVGYFEKKNTAAGLLLWKVLHIETQPYQEQPWA